MEQIISPAEALPGRQKALEIGQARGKRSPDPGALARGMELAWFGMGCFWGVERLFWQQPGVYSTAAGYQGG
jgi:peptide-methionine (S)-S-oxide reductase